MARALGDRAALGWVLSSSYWSRGARSHEEINAMLAEAVEIGEELGDVEIRAEALWWQVPSFVALCDHAGGAGGARAAVRPRAPAERAVPAARRRALRVRARAVRRGSRRCRGGRGAVARVEPPADRPRSVERLRHPDVQPPARAGPPRGAGTGRQGAGHRSTVARPGRRGSPPCWPVSAWRRRLAAELGGSARKGWSLCVTRSGSAR